MRNISDVLHKMGLPILEGYTPAGGFGKNVRQRIERIINQHLDELQDIAEQAASPRLQTNNPSLEEILSKLQKLEKNIDSLTKPALEGLGHNNPPGPIEDEVFEEGEVRESIENLRKELLSEEPDKQKIETNQNVLLRFGFKLAAWTKDRVTDFSEAASKAAGVGFGVWLTGLGSQIVDTVKSLILFLSG